MDKAPISAPFARVIVAATLALAIAPACRSPAFVPSAAACGPARDAPSPLFLESSDGQPRVVPLREDASQKDRARLAGITLYMAARPGQTTESLSRELECQGERAVPCPQGEQCDIPIGRLRVAVRSAGSRFAVDLVASSPAAAREVLRRARALTGIVDDASP